MSLESIIAEALAALFGIGDEYRRTETDPDGDGRPGPNDWTLEGVVNVIRLRAYMDRAVQLVKARRTSAYRSPAVNKAVGGVVGSHHMTGRAEDIVPTAPASIDQAAQVLYQAAIRGELGPLANIILERGATGRGGRNPRIHLDWNPDNPPAAPRIIEDKRF